MNIFIGGVRSIRALSPAVRKKLHSIHQKGFRVLVGDGYGVDSAVQEFFAVLGYENVTVYASNGVARNNIGNWPVANIPAPEGAQGFDFYRQKDLAMAQDADYGLLVWDGQSEGPFCNIVSLARQGKTAAVFLTDLQKMVVVKSTDDARTLVRHCPQNTRAALSRFLDDAHADRQLQIDPVTPPTLH